jgi:hypothetical protein
MFRFGRRKRQKRSREIANQISSIQRLVFERLRPEFVKEHGSIAGLQLGQAVVDRFFARPASLQGDDAELVQCLSNEIARNNRVVRDAAFVTLKVMIEVEGATNDFQAERRILETINWLEQFGEIPEPTSLKEALEKVRLLPDHQQISSAGAKGKDR